MSFRSEVDDLSRVPVSIVSGFLGSGKTTLINSLLKEPSLSRTAVAINEFGEMPIDQHLIDHGADSTIVMANGCLCCNLAGNMEEAVMRVFSRRESGEVPNFDRLIVEPSGLSDPAPIAHAIMRHPLMSRAFSLESMIVTVDAVLAEQQIDKYQEVRKQISLAEFIVITKCDLASDNRQRKIEEILSQLNPTASLRASPGDVSAAAIFSSRFLRPSDGYQTMSGWLDRFRTETDQHRRQISNHLSAERISTTSLESQIPLPWQAFDSWLRKIRIAHGRNLLRVKGIVDVRGCCKPVVIQAVQHVAQSPVELRHWPTNDRRTRLVFIAKDFDVSLIDRSWKEFLHNVVETT